MKSLKLMLLYLLFVVAKAQSQQQTLDSLHTALQNAPNDTIRMDVLSGLGYYYDHSNADSVEFYLGQSLSISRKLNLKLYEAGSLSSLAYHYAWSDYPKALQLVMQALAIAEDSTSEKTAWNLQPGHTPHKERLALLGYIYFNSAQLFGNTGDIKKQMQSLRKSMEIAESLGDSILNMIATMNLGTIYLDKIKKFDSTLYFEQKALNFFSPINGDKSSIGWIYGSMGAAYLEQGNFHLSRNAFQKGLQWMQDQNNLAGVGSLCLSLSKLYRINGKHDSSLLYAYRALETYKIFKDRKGIADAWSSLSLAYGEQKKTDSAFVYLKLATALRDSLGNVEKENLIAFENKSFNEQMRVKDLENEKIQIQTKIRTYAMLAGIGVFMIIASLLYRNNRHRKKANLLLQKQKEEIADQKENIEQAMVELKSTQQQLIQSEKMASLGELTAGIAHEIQNPLNFVNNFSEVNKELVDELQIELKAGNTEEAIAISNDIKDNEEKINHHGKRADAIVKGMLQHTRENSRQKELTDINKLADDYLKLAYNGFRAKDKLFNTALITNYDESVGTSNIVAQDIARVLLNIYNNAFYAVKEKSKLQLLNYEPTITVTTIRRNDKVEISITDNGNGIPQKVINKIFQPFFTTKPTGQGTGLGLSLSYDIIKAHGGEIKVNTKDGEFTEFQIII